MDSKKTKYGIFNYFDMKDVEECCSLVEPGQYRVLSPDELPGPLKETSLLAKVDSVLVLASGSENGTVFVMFNVNRVDGKAQAVDQNPFAFAFSGSSITTSGTILQHGAYEGRTTSPGPEFFEHIQASGIGSCYPIASLPTTSSGSLDDLKNTAQTEAFNIMVDELRTSFLKEE